MILRASSLKPKSLAARRVASECQKLSNPAAGEASTAHSISSTTSFRNMAGILNCSVAKSKPTTETHGDTAQPSRNQKAKPTTEAQRSRATTKTHHGGTAWRSHNQRE